MGLFKDMRTLSKQGREMQKNMDVKASMAQGLASMQQANAMIEQQTANATMALHGTDSTATVVAVRPTGMQMNFSPVIDLDLTVFRNGVPVPMTHREAVAQVYLARAQPGATLKVKIDPANPSSLWIDWTAA